MSIECTISCQRLFVPNLVVKYFKEGWDVAFDVGVVIKSHFKENSCSECLDKTEEVIKDRFTS